MILRLIERALYARLRRRRIERCDHVYHEVDPIQSNSTGHLTAVNMTPVEQCRKCGHRRFQPVVSTTNDGNIGSVTLDGTTSRTIEVE